MKLPRFTMVVLTIVPATAANCSRPHGRTLSATAKKPASVAGCLYPMLSKILSKTSPTALFLPQARLSLRPRPRKLIIQTPSSL